MLKFVTEEVCTVEQCQHCTGVQRNVAYRWVFWKTVHVNTIHEEGVYGLRRI